MKILKWWGWGLLVCSACLWLYVWLEGPPNGIDLLNRNNIELTAIILAIVCLLLAITMGVIYSALKQNRINR
jgi:hypothetical protein